VRAIDLLHLGTDRVVGTWEHEGVLIDPGPQSCEATLLAALGEERPRAVLLTHIHFDHAGVTGALVRRWPDLPVHVHVRGAPHLAAPERLVASAGRLYGPENMQRLWGDVVPVPEQNLHPLEGGETVLGDYEVAYTPGHASHHVAYLHRPTGMAVVGDVAGVRIPPADYVVAPTPPPEVDVEAWERSLDQLEAWAPEALGLTHFGQVDDVGPHLLAVRERLHEEVLLAARHGEEAFVAGMRQRTAEHAGDVEPQYEQAARPEHVFLGLARWHRKRAEAAGQA
jgi:glyoxylase-like metal-dependent hydrolase (beta-lactamase superfamily II)